MLPLIAAVGGVIGTLYSLAKGASWLSDEVGATKGSGSVGGKAASSPLSAGQAASFSATLAAQSAGQPVPYAVASVTPTAAVLPLSGSTDYDMLARMKAGAMAYSHIGGHHEGHSGAVTPPAADDSVAVAQS